VGRRSIARREFPDDIGDIMVSNNWDETEMPIIEGRLSSARSLRSYDLLDRIVKPLERIPG
jgi:hypothetical protein